MDDDKERIRQQMRRLRGALGRDEAALCSARVAERVRGLPEWSAARALALYAPAAGEVDVLALAREGLATGRAVCFPRVEGEALRFLRVAALDELRPGAFGIAAPGPDAPEAAEAIDLYLVPGLAFDRRGRRLGRGRGCYDRALRGARGFKLGVGFAFQLADELPYEAHDVAMDAIVTDAEVVRTGAPREVAP